jgi:hypothetical protein
MSANTSLLTDASRLSATQNTENYAEGVAVHINGDWSQHYQFVVIPQAWIDSCGNTIPGSQRLRIPLTAYNTDVNVVVPIIPFIPPTSGVAPSIITPPTAKNIGYGETARFAVIADGTPMLTYQWYHNGNLIQGATSNQLAVTNAALDDAGLYSCTISNDFGQITTTPVQLYVQWAQRNWRETTFWEDVVDFFDSGPLYGLPPGTVDGPL